MNLELDEQMQLVHEGVLRRSGRYPWGSGENPHQRNKSFLDHVDTLKKQGMSDVEIVKALGLKSTTELRAVKSIAKNEIKKAEISEAMTLKARGMGYSEIGRKMGKNESSVRSLLDEQTQINNERLRATSNRLKEELGTGLLDVGVGTEHFLGISNTQLKIAVAQLKEEGYEVFYLPVPQLGTNNKTTVQVLAPPGTKFPDVVKNQADIKRVIGYSEDKGKTFKDVDDDGPLKSISAKRVEVRTGDKGGADMDGVIQLRRGVDDISMGTAKYAQVRMAVDKTHYLKGMAVYTDDLPAGIDVRFNTNKTTSDLQAAVAAGKAPNAKLASMKAIKDDVDSPFGSIVRPKHYVDANGKTQRSVLNIVNEEGQWDTWSSKLSSQFLSKQSPALAREQLGVRLKKKQEEFEEIMSLTNPSVRKKLLETFADDADSSSVHLKAAGLPRTKTKVILPVNSLKDTEVYAPTFRDGERVVLVRHPHGGKFEIPELTVNNRNPDAKRVMKNAIDAIGINSKVAARLSGADFDGDTVLVIPNNSRKVKSESPLQGLKNFDPQTQYKGYEGMPKMSPRTKQLKMGDVSNLITDMTIRGASHADLAAAVRHSMVVIDAEKHDLNWRQSAKDNNISELKRKYQGEGTNSRAGASTIISKASSEARIPDRKPRPAKDGGPIDPRTGQRVYVEKGTTYISSKTGKEVTSKIKVARMLLTDDANTLSSGQPMEKVYADYANSLKSVANKARVTALNTKTIPYSPSAKVAYKGEVSSLQAKLNTALKNAPLERQAQLVANAIVRAKLDANPGMDASDLKKVKGKALETARDRVGAKKTRVDITPSEWKAIQAGAISKSQLERILNNADIDQVKQLATPRKATVMDVGKMARANSMLAAGYTQAEIADALGVPVSTLNSAINVGS